MSEEFEPVLTEDFGGKAILKIARNSLRLFWSGINSLPPSPDRDKISRKLAEIELILAGMGSKEPS